MNTSPAMLTRPTLREQRAFLPARGGTLGRVNTQYPALFSFLGQTAQQFHADRADLHEPVAVSLAAGAGAAMDRRGSPSRAESRPFPFPQINHVTHSHLLLSSETTGTAIPGGGHLVRVERHGSHG